MKGFYDTLRVRYNACPPGCTACEEACASRKKGIQLGATIKAVDIEDVNFHGVIVCNQCSKPRCEEVCPTGAITKDEATGVVQVSEEQCAGCGLCTLVCPYGGIFYNADKKKAFKCDNCGGQPACVEACPYGVLSFARSSPVYSYLGEDLTPKGVALCPGCAAELAMRFMIRVLGRDIVLFSGPSCGAMITGGSGTRSTVKVPVIICLFWNTSPAAAGFSRYYRKLGKEVTCVCFMGDGATADIGFQALSGAAERGERILYICYDNEAYMNTGIQRSGTTPLYAWSSTTPIGVVGGGKERVAKNMPLLMLMHEIPYVATATTAYLEDYARKLVKAKEATKDGLAYIHLLTPCPTGWRAPSESVIELSRMAVETNYFPLWEAERGKLRLTYKVKEPKPMTEFTKLMGRFSHLGKEELEQLQEMVDSRFSFLQALALLPTPV